MSASCFNVIFQGELISPDQDQIVKDFAELFNISEGKAEQLLTSDYVVLKKAVEEKKALIYQKRLSAIGVLVNLEPVIDEIESLITLEPDPENVVSEDIEVVNNETKSTTSFSTSPADVESTIFKAGDDGHEQDKASSFTTMSVDQLEVESGPQEHTAATNFAMADDIGRIKRIKFKFTGNGAEFFKIWIVNIFLSIITLGIYSAWAKVRTNKYFYGNTWLNDSAFDYLADPVTILKGRVIAVVLFLAYVLSGEFYPEISGILLLVFLIFLPWLISKSLRFRMRYTAYRNIRFGFDGTVWEAAKAYTLMLLLLPFTLGLLFPYMIYMQARYFVSNTRYGIDQFTFTVSSGQYYRIYLTAAFALFLSVIASGIMGLLNPLLSVLVLMAGYVLVVTFIQVETINLMFDNTQLGDHSFSSSLEIWPYFKLYFVNTIAIILTLGLFYPWAKVRIARYRTENLQMMLQGNLDHYVEAQQQDVKALGEEAGDIFDIDLAF